MTVDEASTIGPDPDRVRVAAGRRLGSTADTWGRTWSAADFSAANFRVRIIDLSSSTARTFYLDAVGVSVTYR